MKKFLIAIVLLFSLCLTGCFKTNLEAHENSITFTLNDDYTSVLEVSEIPSFTFTFNGNLNTVATNTKKFVNVFSDNEDKILSDALNELFKKYKDRMYVQLNGTDNVSTTLFSTLNKYGSVENVKYHPDDSKVYEETAFISLENGLKLSIDYRRFVYNGENYYSWKYTQSLTMYLYYPMMAIEKGLKNKLVLITLPNGITFQVGPDLSLKHVLNGTTYIDDEDCPYYTFRYFVDPNEKEEDKKDENTKKSMRKKGDDKPLTPEEIAKIEKDQKYVIDYYVNDLNARYDKDTKKLYYNYLGNDFVVELYNNYFKMHYIPTSE